VSTVTGTFVPRETAHSEGGPLADMLAMIAFCTVGQEHEQQLRRREEEYTAHGQNNAASCQLPVNVSPRT